jgi:hypothetical protein
LVVIGITPRETGIAKRALDSGTVRNILEETPQDLSMSHCEELAAQG